MLWDPLGHVLKACDTGELPQESLVTLEGVLSQERDLTALLANVQPLDEAAGQGLPGQRGVEQFEDVLAVPHGDVRVLECAEVDLGWSLGDEARQSSAEALAGAEIFRIFLPVGEQVVAEGTLVDEPEFVANLARTHEVGACGYIAVHRPLAERLEFSLGDGHESPDELPDLDFVFLMHDRKISGSSLGGCGSGCPRGAHHPGSESLNSWDLVECFSMSGQARR